MAHHQYVINVNVNVQLSCGFVMIIVQSWMGVLPVRDLSGPFLLSAGSEHYFGHDSLCMLLWVFCQSLWLGQMAHHQYVINVNVNGSFLAGLS